MSDLIKPVLKGLQLPALIDVSSGRGRGTVTAHAADEGGSGIRDVFIILDRRISMDYGLADAFLVPAGGHDTFGDATPYSASTELVVTSATAPGNYAITGVWVYDNAGNATGYTADELRAAGIDTRIRIVGGIDDRIAPVLAALTLPETLDVGGGLAPFVASVRASDEGGSGIADVTVFFDRPLGFDAGASDRLLLPGSSRSDTFNDTTPNTANGSYTLTDKTAPGTYHITRVEVQDRSGNVSAYTTAELEALGMRTAMTVSGGIADDTAPALTSLELPVTIDLSSGAANVEIRAGARDNEGGTGVRDVVVYLDGALGYQGWSFANFAVPQAGSTDTFDDATPHSATSWLPLRAHTPVGTYGVTRVVVTDVAGNSRDYDSAELEAMGIRTTMNVTDGRPDAAPARVATTIAPDSVVHRVTTSAWGDGEWTAFKLVFEYDATQASYRQVVVKDMGNELLEVHTSISGGVGRVVLGGFTSAEVSKAPAIDVVLQPLPGAQAFGYAVKSFVTGEFVQGFDHTGAGVVRHGTAGADRIDSAERLTQIDAGAGLDWVAFSGAAAGYTVRKSVDGYTVDDGDGYVAHLRNVERLAFGDVAFALDVDGAPGQVYRLYQAAFARKPDLGGIGFWIDQVEDGMRLDQAAGHFLDSPEFTAKYGAGVTDGVFVDALYRNVLQRAPDQGGKAFWLAALADGFERSELLLAFSDSAENVGQVAALIGNGFAYTPWG